MSSPQLAARPHVRRRLSRLSTQLMPRNERPLALMLLALTALATTLWLWPEYLPISLLVVPMVVANLILGPRQLPWFVAASLLMIAVLVPRQPDITPRTAIAVVVLFLVGFLILLASFRRQTLGVAGVQGEAMLVDLRDRILRQGQIPDLPPGWYAASELRSAGGTAFAGDFIVASRTDDRLDVAVVDVSGKGESAGTRALLLAGALGGLLSALQPQEFLEEANAYLLDQDWGEGFATAIHLTVDLHTGAYQVRSAGHPPAALRTAGSGRWSVLPTVGPMLGLIDEVQYEPVDGVMRPGDALVLYTDGMVETRNRDIMLGVDKMLGQAELLLRGNFDGGAARLIEAIGSRDDDRALMLVHRR